MCWDLKNKVVVITGGGNGIGYNIADKYLQAGAKVIILVDINEAHGVEATEKLNTKYGKNKAIFLKCDVTTDVEDISKKIFSTYTVDVLVNSAGIIDEVVPKNTIDINVTAVIDWSFKFWKHMRKDQGGNGGTIIIISSVAGFTIDQYFPTYEASKHAVMAYTRSLGHVVNYERSGVRVMSLCPGATKTGISFDRMFWNEYLNDEVHKLLKSLYWQNADSVGNAAVEIYEKASSGTAWIIQDDKPVVEVTN